MAARRLENDLKEIIKQGINSYLVEANFDDVKNMSITIRMVTQNKLNAKVDIKIPEDYPFKAPDLLSMEIELFTLSYEPIQGSKSKGKEQIYRRVCDARVLTEAECLEFFQLFSYVTKYTEDNKNYIKKIKEELEELETRVRQLETKRNAIADSTQKNWLDKEIVLIDGKRRGLMRIINFTDIYLGYESFVPLYFHIENVVFPLVNFYSRLFAPGQGGNLNDALVQSTQNLLKL